MFGLIKKKSQPHFADPGLQAEYEALQREQSRRDVRRKKQAQQDRDDAAARAKRRRAYEHRHRNDTPWAIGDEAATRRYLGMQLSVYYPHGAGTYELAIDGQQHLTPGACYWQARGDETLDNAQQALEAEAQRRYREEQKP